MNTAYLFFLTTLLGSHLFISASQAPLKKSGPISIPAVTIEIPEVNSYESDEMHSNATNSSQISPKSSHSPIRRPSEGESINPEDLFPEPKIFNEINQNCSPERKRNLLNVLETRLRDFSQRLHKERILQEEKDVLAKSYYSFPGDTAKLCTLEELKTAEKEAVRFWLIED